MIARSILLFGLLPALCGAQVDKGGTPVSWSLYGEISPGQDFVTLNPPDVAALLDEDALKEINKDEPLRMAQAAALNVSPNQSGQWFNRQNGDRVWQLGVRSEGALHLGIVFDFLDIPKGAYIYIYNDDQSDFIGPYTSQNSTEDVLVTVPVNGDAVVIEYYEPFAVRGAGSFSIAAVNHGYRDLSLALKDAKPCLMPFNEHVPDWAHTDKAVVMVLAGYGTRIATGALLNNTGNDGTPFLLTHASAARFGDPASWVFVMKPGSGYCQAQSLCWNRSLNGASALVADETTGILLLKLFENPPAHWNTWFGGWSIDDAPEGVYCLQHALGGPLSFAFSDFVPVSVSWMGHASRQIDHWQFGSTFSGSLGAPMVTHSGLITGLFDGGTITCASEGRDYFIPLSAVWNDLKNYLDPLNKGGKSLGGAYIRLEDTEGDSDEVLLYPNPARSTATIAGDTRYLKRVWAYDMTGRRVAQLMPQFGTVDVSVLPAGVYRLRLDYADQVKSSTLVVSE